MTSGYILHLAWPGAMLLSAMVAGLTLFALFRHASRRSHLHRLHGLESKLQPLLQGLFARSIEYGEGLRQIRAVSTNSRARALEELLMADRNPSPERIAVLQKLCQDLGLIEAWTHRLVLSGTGTNGKNRPPVDRPGHPFGFVLRAEAAENLGIIRHQPSWPLLVDALSDPHVTVRSVAARALARIREPESFCRVAEHLRSAALESVPEISPATLKMALAAFPPEEAVHLREFLEDPCWQVRCLAAEVVSVMLQQAAERMADDLESSLHPLVLDIFFRRLACDENAEVRARTAVVAGLVNDFRSLPVLRELVNDAEWFVRLHAVRALVRSKPTPLSTIGARLTDPNWHVREAAAQAMCELGRTGIGRLFHHFSDTADRYSREQIAEQIGKAGILPSLLETFDRPGRESERKFLEGMVRIGKSEALLSALGNGGGPRDSEALFRALASKTDLEIRPLAERFDGAAMKRN